MLWVIGLGLLVGGTWATHAIVIGRAETRQYREEHSEAKIRGKTAEEVIAMYGEPYALERGRDGSCLRELQCRKYSFWIASAASITSAWIFCRYCGTPWRVISVFSA